MKAVLALFGRPQVLRACHGWAAVVWTVMMPISILTGLKSMVPYLVFLSVYALMVGHFSSWQAARVEVRQDQEIDDATR